MLNLLQVVPVLQFGGNYAASYAAKSKAAQFGYDHVLWLDGTERSYIEELNNMNIFFVINHTLITPALDGITVPGVTRQSVIDLAKRIRLSNRRKTN